MKKFMLVIMFLTFIFANISCRTTSHFTSDEIAEFSSLAKSLNEIDFTYGAKYKEYPHQLKLFKVIQTPYHEEESFFSLKDFPLINGKIFAVEKQEKEIFIKFKIVLSGWCTGIVYMFEEDEYLRNRAEVFIELDENVFYFEGKS